MTRQIVERMVDQAKAEMNNLFLDQLDDKLREF